MFLCASFDGGTHTHTHACGADDDRVRDGAATMLFSALGDLATSCPWQIAEKQTSTTVMQIALTTVTTATQFLAPEGTGPQPKETMFINDKLISHQA
ncbi:hypothetical protein QQF64_008540 [Cirrhinus molitorella]|uniref:Uncharacterized protein n=1 Tax=Cirrhinus molitorella TaxID=172907 RepID=A0ABR3M6F8_9TELE